MNREKKNWTLAPLLGAALFLLLYFAAACNYPGGSQADAHAKGFSWRHNYWCNLLNEKALNGEANTGRPFGYAAMLFLVLSLLSFGTIAVRRLGFSKPARILLIACGLLCLLVLPFLPTAYHDSVVNVSASAGLAAMILIYVAHYKRGWQILFWFGVFNLLLVALNNYIYYRTSLYYLPVVQKFTFLSFLLWVCAVTMKLYRQQRQA